MFGRQVITNIMTVYQNMTFTLIDKTIQNKPINIDLELVIEAKSMIEANSSKKSAWNPATSRG